MISYAQPNSSNVPRVEEIYEGSSENGGDGTGGTYPLTTPETPRAPLSNTPCFENYSTKLRYSSLYLAPERLLPNGSGPIDA